MKHCFKIKVGLCVFSVSAPEDIGVDLHPNMAPFQIKNNNSLYHIDIQIRKGVPEFREKPKQLTNARNLPEFHERKVEYHFYILSKTPSAFIISSGNEESEREFDRVAVSDFNFKNWTIYISEKESLGKINPLSFPIGPLIFYYSLTLCNGIMLHASGVNYNNKGYIFSGVSGIGKTTISNIWLENGGELINDDRLVLMRNSNRFTMYNSPMAYYQELKTSPVSSVFLLKQSKENYLNKLSKGTALARVLSLCIQHDHDKVLVDSLMNNVHELIEMVPVYELGFKPDRSVVQFVEESGL